MSPGDNHLYRIRLWDAGTGNIKLRVYYKHPSPIHSYGPVQLSPNCTRIAGVWDNMMHVWDAQDGKHLLEIVDHNTTGITTIAFSHDGTRIASVSNHRLRIWNAENGNTILGPIDTPNADRESTPEERTMLPLKEDRVTFSPCGDRILQGQINTILVRDTWDGKILLGPFQEHTCHLTSMNFSHDGACIATGWNDGTIRVCDARTPDTATGSSDNTGAIADWKLREDGWVVENQSRLLIWVPHDLRKGLMQPRTTLLLSREGHLVLNFDSARIGEAWTRCYVSDTEN
ncbi:hypothetical protein B0J17DRAFT_712895 [Rhizoctonia solani]|nr:hypothetical protein B0J17DRAFT_712895 [Rhizoctonia solani]